MKNFVRPLGAILMFSMAVNAWGETPVNPFRPEKVQSRRSFVRLAELHRFEATAPQLFVQVAYRCETNINTDDADESTATPGNDAIFDALPDGPNELPHPVTVKNRDPMKSHPEPIDAPKADCEPPRRMLLTEPGGCVLTPPTRHNDYPSGVFSDRNVVMSDVIVEHGEPMLSAGDGPWSYCDTGGCDTFAAGQESEFKLVSSLKKLRRVLLGR